jgi:hypothetical protein
MKLVSIWGPALALCFLISLAEAGENISPAQTPNTNNRNLQSPPQELLREVLGLRLEVYRQGVELADWKIRQLDTRFEESQAQFRSIDEEERAIMQDLIGLDSPDGEIGARRSEMSADELPRLREQKRIIQQRVADTETLGARERERRSRLVELAKQAEARLKEVAAR